MSYNGWTNRETWLVNLLFDPQCKEDLEIAEQMIEEDISNCPIYLQDFINQHHINWAELYSHFEDEEDDTLYENEDNKTTENEESEDE